MSRLFVTPQPLRAALWVILAGPLVFSALMYAAFGGATPWPVIWRQVAITYLHFAGYGGGYLLLGPAVRRLPVLPGWARSILRFLAASFAGSAFALGLTVLLGWKPPGEFLQSMPRSLGLGMTVMLVCLFIERLYRQMLASRSEAAQRAIQQEMALRLAAEAQWNSLESRVRPHFLFNTLSSIRELVHQDPDQAEKMIERFADLLRTSLDAPRSGAAPLEDEIATVQNYLEIERMRLGARLAWSLECPAETMNCTLPALSLLTLVENSVKHVISLSRAGGSIRVSAERDGPSVVLCVQDGGPGFSLDQCPPGHGIDLLQRRLDALFGPQASLAAGPAGTVILRCPCKSASEVSQ